MRPRRARLLFVLAAAPILLGSVLIARPRPAPTVAAVPECRVAEVHATVARAVFESWFAPDVVARTSRIIPVLEAGRGAGFKIVGLRPGSALAMIGLRKGDVVRRIEGLSLATTAEALEAYTVLRARRPDRFLIEILRDGCPVVVVVTIA